LNRENDFAEICQVAARIFDHSADLPFALLYLLEADGQIARLQAAAGWDGYLGPANPPAIDLKQSALDVWPLAEVAASGRSLALDDLDRRFGSLPSGESPRPPHSALVLPLGPPGPASHYGFLIAGLSPRLLLDDRYRGFLELAADQIATALRKARAHEEELHRAESLARADRAKDEFLAMLGHELRNPLSPIVTVLQLMKLRGETALSDERSIIERHVQHVERLVDDLLEVSRLTRGRVSLERQVIDVAEIVSRALEMSSQLIEQRLHTLIVTAPSGAVCVNDDALRMARVIANLLTNAAKYTEPRGRITVGWSRDGADAVISVKDNGHGMDPEFAARVFDSFSQAPTESSSKPAGLGLGLAIVKSLVGMHGGSITVASAGLGQGSEFTVCLPPMTAFRATFTIRRRLLCPRRPVY
jgi:signal transduction histidine kinase